MAINHEIGKVVGRRDGGNCNNLDGSLDVDQVKKKRRKKKNHFGGATPKQLKASLDAVEKKLKEHEH